MSRYRSILNVLGGGGFLLDQYPSSTSVYGYSLRKLSSSYSGPVVRVRRDSDNAESDIGFNSDNEIDTDALIAFVGSNHGYVTTWYDQGGLGNNISSSAATRQPRVAIGGTVRITDGKPSMFYNTDLLGGARINELHNGTNCFVAALVKSNYNTTARQSLVATCQNLGSNTGYQFHMVTSSSDHIVSNVRNGSGLVSSNITPGDYPENSRYLITDVLDVSNSTLANRSTINVNNSSDINNNTSNGIPSTSNSTRGLMVGATVSDSYFRGDMQEIIIYTSDQSSNKAGIIENINNHYLVY